MTFGKTENRTVWKLTFGWFSVYWKPIGFGLGFPQDSNDYITFVCEEKDDVVHDPNFVDYVIFLPANRKNIWSFIATPLTRNRSICAGYSDGKEVEQLEVRAEQSRSDIITYCPEDGEQGSWAALALLQQTAPGGG
jgi:hypothetical protein